MLPLLLTFLFFFFNDTATTEIYTLSLHDALPIYLSQPGVKSVIPTLIQESGDNAKPIETKVDELDRKSTRLNSSHSQISYAVFCLKKKKKKKTTHTYTIKRLQNNGWIKFP